MSKSQEQLNRTKLKKAMELPRPRGVLSGRIVALSMFGSMYSNDDTILIVTQSDGKFILLM